MFAAVAAGEHPDLPSVQEAMGAGFESIYKPIPENAVVYDRIYRKYKSLGQTVEDSIRKGLL